MWIRLFRAELRKITGNRWVTGCLIWIFPILALFLVGFTLVVAAVSASARQGMLEDPDLWTETALIPWFVPNSPVGRLLLIGFTAVLFAGEYQWNTWKVVVPRSWRIPLILVKFGAVALFVIFAFALMSVILVAGEWLVLTLVGAPYGPPLTGDVLAEFAGDYSLQVANAFMTTIVAAGYAALAAMITRSILGSVITAVVASLVEGLLVIPLALLSTLLDVKIVFHLYRLTPTYNLLNLFVWLSGDEAPPGFEAPWGEVIIDDVGFHLAVLGLWVVGLIALTAYLFQRQDIVN